MNRSLNTAKGRYLRAARQSFEQGNGLAYLKPREFERWYQMFWCADDCFLDKEEYSLSLCFLWAMCR